MYNRIIVGISIKYPEINSWTVDNHLDMIMHIYFLLKSIRSNTINYFFVKFFNTYHINHRIIIV